MEKTNKHDLAGRRQKRKARKVTEVRACDVSCAKVWEAQARLSGRRIKIRWVTKCAVIVDMSIPRHQAGNFKCDDTG